MLLADKKFVMHPDVRLDEALRASERLEPSRALPIIHNTFPPIEHDAEDFAPDPQSWERMAKPSIRARTRPFDIAAGATTAKDEAASGVGFSPVETERKCPTCNDSNTCLAL